MASTQQTSSVSFRSLLGVFLLTVLLLTFASAAAEVAPALADSAHSTMYYRVIFTLWAATLLLTVSLCLYILQRPSTTTPMRLLFWTASYVAYLYHLYWVVLGTATDLEWVMRHYWMSFLLAAWWGIDVLLGWLVSSNPRWVQLQRGLVHVYAFLVFLGATALAATAGPFTRFLGVVMALVVMACFGYRTITREMDPGSLLSVLYVRAFQILNWFVPWHRLPTFLGAMNLAALREVLRAQNLHSTSDIAVTNLAGLENDPAFDASLLGARQVDGYFNDLKKPSMGTGSATPGDPKDADHFTRSNPGARFGRNVPLSAAWPESGAALLSPSPRTISRRLLARDKFLPATSLNLLAAAWIQFEIHDWFFHGEPIVGNEIEIPLDTGDDWGPNPMRVRRTRPDPTRRPNEGVAPPSYCNAEAHWWDGSQIYGSNPLTAAELRAGKGGELRLQNDMLSMDPATGTVLTGFNGNWWAGLSLLHTLFTREHNAICANLRQAYPHWAEDDERLFQTVRLINAALMAKIHTVEWTPAIVAHPALKIGMNANWWGLAGEGIKKAFGRISDSEAFSGIPGSETNHHTADFAFTEEFVSVYRMHPLMPDVFDLFSVQDGSSLHHFVLPTDFVGPSAGTQMLSHGGIMADVFYSFGICHPGKITLRNYPAFLRKLTRPDGEVVDLATIDIMRDRERGVPRYNQFRQFVHLPRIRSFHQLTPDPQLARDLEEIYEGNIDRVDLMVGMYAETPPTGFGFSDTGFRIFILMASRRLKSDRLFTTDFTPEIYTPAGMDWLNANNMRTVLLRHYPSLAPALRGVDNAFQPWKTIAESEHYQPHGVAPRL